ncbi:MAG: type II toxin-antitoxin system Phd/YefM family antitoxin [Atopobiaceae bacterium]|nr:type II toxin-antitoxin system Phd/YefM family antitoxin [Atopobiaceae bacterium]
MTLPAAVLDNIVSVSEFSRGGASRAFEKAQGSTPVIVVKNNKPTAIITSPEEYAYLSETEEDFILLSEAIIRLVRNDAQPSIPFDEVAARLGIQDDDLDTIDDVELE